MAVMALSRIPDYLSLSHGESKPRVNKESYYSADNVSRFVNEDASILFVHENLPVLL